MVMLHVVCYHTPFSKMAIIYIFLMPHSRQNILLNFKLKNEASRANNNYLNKNKRIFKWWPFWKKLYFHDQKGCNLLGLQ